MSIFVPASLGSTLTLLAGLLTLGVLIGELICQGQRGGPEDRDRDTVEPTAPVPAAKWMTQDVSAGGLGP